MNPMPSTVQIVTIEVWNRGWWSPKFLSSKAESVKFPKDGSCNCCEGERYLQQVAEVHEIVSSCLEDRREEKKNDPEWGR